MRPATTTTLRCATVRRTASREIFVTTSRVIFVTNWSTVTDLRHNERSSAMNDQHSTTLTYATTTSISTIKPRCNAIKSTDTTTTRDILRRSATSSSRDFVSLRRCVYRCSSVFLLWYIFSSILSYPLPLFLRPLFSPFFLVSTLPIPFHRSTAESSRSKYTSPCPT